MSAALITITIIVCILVYGIKDDSIFLAWVTISGANHSVSGLYSPYKSKLPYSLGRYSGDQATSKSARSELSLLNNH